MLTSQVSLRPPIWRLARHLWRTDEETESSGCKTSCPRSHSWNVAKLGPQEPREWDWPPRRVPCARPYLFLPGKFL